MNDEYQMKKTFEKDCPKTEGGIKDLIITDKDGSSPFCIDLKNNLKEAGNPNHTITFTLNPNGKKTNKK